MAIFGIAGRGGGINNQGKLAVTDCIVEGNEAWAIGGGIYDAGYLTLTRSTVNANLATDPFVEGAGLFIDRKASATVVDSEIRALTVEARGEPVLINAALPLKL